MHSASRLRREITFCGIRRVRLTLSVVQREKRSPGSSRVAEIGETENGQRATALGERRESGLSYFVVFAHFLSFLRLFSRSTLDARLPPDRLDPAAQCACVPASPSACVREMEKRVENLTAFQVDYRRRSACPAFHEDHRLCAER